MGALKRFGKPIAWGLNLGLIASYAGLVGIALAGRMTWMADFTSQYTGAFLIREGMGGRLYDLALQQTVQQRLLGGRHLGDGLLPYNHPPHTALLMTPLAFLPLEWAYGVWMGINLIVWGLFLRDVWTWARSWAPGERALMVIALTALPFWFRALLLGAFSIWETFVLWRFYWALRRGRETAAGLYLALGSVHPAVTLFPLLAIVGSRRWRAVSTWSLGVGTAFLASALLLGSAVWIDFLRMMQFTATIQDHPGIDPRSMYNLKGVLTVALGTEAWGWIQGITWGALWIGALGVLTGWAATGLPRGPRMDLQLGLTVTAGLFLSPHLNPQDALLIALPALWLANARRSIGQPDRAFEAVAAGSPAALFISDLPGMPLLGMRLPVVGMLVLAGWIGWALRRRPGESDPAVEA
ncbi:MAG: glycosyltransferase family 87 protein [Anaerolineae bacterium]|nr:glycosyltransferase family 87 protein [Anaerolineae bacterium]